MWRGWGHILPERHLAQSQRNLCVCGVLVLSFFGAIDAFMPLCSIIFPMVFVGRPVVSRKIFGNLSFEYVLSFLVFFTALFVSFLCVYCVEWLFFFLSLGFFGFLFIPLDVGIFSYVSLLSL